MRIWPKSQAFVSKVPAGILSAACCQHQLVINLFELFPARGLRHAGKQRGTGHSRRRSRRLQARPRGARDSLLLSGRHSVTRCLHSLRSICGLATLHLSGKCAPLPSRSHVPPKREARERHAQVLPLNIFVWIHC